MKKMVPLVVATLLVASHVLFGQSSTDAPTNSTDKHATHLQNKFVKQENKMAAYFNLESSLFTGRMNVLCLQTGIPYQQIPSCLGAGAATMYEASMLDIINIDTTNPAAVNRCYFDLLSFQQDFLTQNIPAGSEFEPLCTVSDLSSMLEILRSMKDSSDFAAIIKAFSKIDKERILAELCIFDYVEAYVLAQASEPAANKGTLNQIFSSVNAQLSDLKTPTPLDILSIQAQVIQIENSYPAPTPIAPDQSVQ